jgi:hypothetical protein
MIAKGTPHKNGAKLGRYMITGKEDERAELVELRGFASSNIVEAFRSIHVIAEGTKCQQPFFHVQVRNPEGETLTREQWIYTADRIERMLGLKDQPRAITLHIDEKTGHEHMHVAWSRIDEETLTAKRLPFYKTRLKKLCRELEETLGLTRVPNERASAIKYAPTRDQEEQARRLGLNVHEIRDAIRACWDRSDCGRSFEATLAYEGMLLARGERRDFVVVDHAGGMHALGKRILDASAAQIRERLKDLPREYLPTVEQAKSFAQERGRLRDKSASPAMPDAYRDELSWEDKLARAAIEKERRDPQFVEQQNAGRAVGKDGSGRSPFEPPKGEPSHPQLNRTSPEYWFEDAAREINRDKRPVDPPENLKGAGANIWTAYNRSQNSHEFVAALGERGITPAVVTKDEADRSYRTSSFARAIGNVAPVYREGEIVCITEGARVYKLEERTTGDDRRGIDSFLKDLDRSSLQGIDATKQAMHERAKARAANAELMRIAYPVKSREDRPIDGRPTGALGRTMRARAGESSSRLVKQTTRVAANTLDTVANAVESLLAPQITPEQRRQAEIDAREQRQVVAEKSDLARVLADLAEEQRRKERTPDVGRRREDDGRER